MVVGRFLKYIKNQRAFFLVILLSLAGYLSNIYYDYSRNFNTGTYRRLLTSYDITSNTFIPYEIIINHRIHFGKESLKAMSTIEGRKIAHSVIKINDKYYASYPIMAGIFAVPIYLIPLLLNKIPTLLYYEDFLKVLTLGRIAASIYTAISVGIFFLILKNISKKLNIPITKWTYYFIVFYAFGTNTYAIASRGLWQHTSSIFINSLIILFFIYALDNPKYVKWIGLLCGLSFIARPTNIFLVLISAMYIFMYYRKEFFRFAVLSAVMAAILLFYNYAVFGSPLTNEYAARNDTSFSTPVWVGLGGYLFSPSRSFLFITPPLVLSYYGTFYYMFKKRKEPVEKLISCLSFTFLLTLLMLSMWWCWYGADRFGYGFLTEWLPILGIVTYLLSLKLKGTYKILFVILMIYSFYTQLNAVWFRKSRCNGDHIWDFYCITPVLKEQEY